MSSAVVIESAHPYEDTVARLERAIASSGNTLFARIDQAAAASGAGLSLRPTMLLVFGNPMGGTPLMEAAPLVGLDLPLKVLVWAEGGQTFVARAQLAETSLGYDIAGLDRAKLTALDGRADALIRGAIA